jgi:K+-sensing histidine kinase KdpD
MFNRPNIGYFKTKGIGIGLTTAKVLTQALQGGIHLNSQVGLGTEVGFSILTQIESFKINSKDLKTQARLHTEDHTAISIGKDNVLLK